MDSISSPTTKSPLECWSDQSTDALIAAWGTLHLSLNRGHLRHHHWQQVSSAVNSTTNHHRTPIQCKYRIDTLKKKYKIEKAKTLNSPSSSAYVSPWIFFSRLDSLLSPPPPPPAVVPTSFPVAPRSALPKRPARVIEAFFTRHVADESERKREGWSDVAEAIRRFGEVYERVEVMKVAKLVELERERMKFGLDLEFHRMRLLVDTQLQLARVKRSRVVDVDDADDEDDNENGFL